MLKPCIICDKMFDATNRGLCCSAKCKDINRSNWREAHKPAFTVKKCFRCQEDFTILTNADRYCKECKDIINAPKIKVTKKCKTCPTLVVSSKTYCETCRRTRMKEVAKERTARCQAVKAQTKKPIDPKWLNRGNKSTSSGVGSIVHG